MNSSRFFLPLAAREDTILGSFVFPRFVVCLMLVMMLVACGSDNQAPSAIEESGRTQIGMDGGTAHSADGRLRITIPENAYTLPEGSFPEALVVAIETGPDDGWDLPLRVGRDYFVFVSPPEAAANLHAEATIELDITEDIGEREVMLVGVEETLGLVPRQRFDGERLVAHVTDLTLSHVYAVAHELTRQCAGMIDIGQSCTEDDDCQVNGEETLICACAEADVRVGPSCHRNRCVTPMTSCAGIGVGHEGHCDRAGGWTGDCRIR